MNRPRVWPSLLGAARSFRARPLAHAALGGAIVFSLLTVCCGIGVVTSPWFMCELAAVQLSEALDRPVEHSRSWIAACAMLIGAVLLIGSVGWLTLLGLGPDMPVSDGSLGQLEGLVGGGTALAAACTTLALVFVLPYLYGALILIERPGNSGAAMLESVRLVRAGGVLSHLLLSVAAHSVQASPTLLACLAAALLFGGGAVPLAALVSLPLLCVSVPLGQGMIVSAYMARRHELVDPSQVERLGRPPRRLVVVLALVAFGPLAGLGMLGLSLARPTQVRTGQLPDTAELVGQHVLKAGTVARVRPPQTALDVSATPSWVSVTASDGGGAGRLPLPKRGVYTELTVVRVRNTYGVQVSNGGRAYLTWIDRAGVRQDDTLQARLFDRIPGLGFAWILLTLLVASLAQLPVLSRLARLRRLYALPQQARPAPDQLASERQAALRFAYGAASLLLLPALGALYWGMRGLGLVQ